MDEAIFEDLSDDPELAFLQLEDLFRRDCVQKINFYNGDQFPADEYLEYISRTLAARTELGLDILGEWELPAAEHFNIDEYRDFRRDVDHCCTALKIRRSRRVKGYSVRLDGPTKQKILHYIEKIKDIAQKLEVDDWKRRSLFDKLNDFESEVNRDRTRFEFFGSVVIYASEVLGSAAANAEPARKWLDSIARLIWGVDVEERTERLPSPSERKRVEGPRKQLSPSPFGRRSSDDGIPF